MCHSGIPLPGSLKRMWGHNPSQSDDLIRLDQPPLSISLVMPSHWLSLNLRYPVSLGEPVSAHHSAPFGLCTAPDRQRNSVTESQSAGSQPLGVLTVNHQRTRGDVGSQLPTPPPPGRGGTVGVVGVVGVAGCPLPRMLGLAQVRDGTFSALMRRGVCGIRRTLTPTTA